MDEPIGIILVNLRSDNKEVQNSAFQAVLAVTDNPVTWAYEVWDDLVSDLRHKDNHRRAIAV